jgi:predicted RNA-binding Zn ribbon-like protein
MENGKKGIKDLKIASEDLCLNFLNTVCWQEGTETGEYLKTPEDLALWACRVGVLNRESTDKLLKNIDTQPNQAMELFKRALKLRKAIMRMINSSLQKQPIANKDLKVFNTNLRNTLKYTNMLHYDDGFVLDFSESQDSMVYILYSVVQSAMDLFTSDTFKKVKRCNDPSCGWFFSDSSKNRSRRWCSMEDCGNRSKARRFYEKQIKLKRT